MAGVFWGVLGERLAIWTVFCWTALGGVDGGSVSTHGAVMSGFLFLMGSAIVYLTKSESFVEVCGGRDLGVVFVGLVLSMSEVAVGKENKWITR